MHYWRKDNFEGLKEVCEYLADKVKLQGFRNYCLNRESGLRQKAFVELDRFIKEAALWTFEEKRDFVDWLLWVHHGKPEIYDLVPTPLQTHLVKPTLNQWRLLEPGSSAPYRWSEDVQDLQTAVQLDRNDQIAHWRFARKVLDITDFSTHELPAGYLGSPEEDKILIEAVLKNLAFAIQTDELKKFSARLSENHELISNWILSRNDEG